jgi:hypothetical protein
MPQSPTKDENQSRQPASVDRAKAADEAKAAKERSEQSVSIPGGFANDPDDPANPNEVIERHRRSVRP